MALFSHGLLPASFRGVPFAVYSNSTAAGRRVALHQYPGRDEPWAEDMGREARRFRFTGFIVSDDRVYLGGPVLLQRALLLAAVEKSGPGTLVHPVLGILSVACVRCSIGEEMDAGRYSEIEVEFVESGKRSFPSILTSGSGVLTAANLAKVAIAADVARVLVAAFSAGGQRDKIPATTNQWAGEVVSLSKDATTLQRLTAQLPGDFGRFTQGSNRGYAGTVASPYSADTTVAQLVDDASAQRVAIVEAADALGAAIAGLTVSTTEADLAAAAQHLVDALAAACADPADAIRFMLRLASFVPIGLETATAVGAAICDLFRRSAVVTMASISTSYQPASYDDAFAKLRQVTGALDDEITVAGDEGLDGTFAALRALRVAVVEDLKARGASLSPIRTFVVGGSLPALALAQRFYRDAARADQLAIEAQPVSPLFMPSTVQALAA